MRYGTASNFSKVAVIFVTSSANVIVSDSGEDAFVTCSVTPELAGANHSHSSILGNSRLATT